MNIFLAIALGAIIWLSLVALFIGITAGGERAERAHRKQTEKEHSNGHRL